MTIHDWLEKTNGITEKNTNKPAMLALIHEARAIMGVAVEPANMPSRNDILRAVAMHYEIGIKTMRESAAKSMKIVRPRFVVYYLLREIREDSYPAIGAFMGGRDHTTILHGYQKIKSLMHIDERLTKDVLAITSSLGVKYSPKQPFNFADDNVKCVNF